MANGNDVAEKKVLRSLLDLSTIGLNLVLATFVGLGMGYGLDHVFDKYFGMKTSPWFTIIFLILGIISGFREMIRMARKYNADNQKDI
ncbi:MAG: hypothetical protein FD156_144 [Nitrospirae bacterium]|nr:MAG: hypothetical protein FD156_144 [Nitrospirota bacterium]